MTFPISNQWTDNELINAVKMNARVETKINAAVTYLTGQVRFFGSIVSTAGSIASATNIDFTGHISEDTVAGWNSTNKNWVCPVTGTYDYSAQLKCNSTSAQPVAQLFFNGALYHSAFLGPSQAFAGSAIAGYIRCTAGTTLSLRTSAAFLTQNDGAHNNFLQIQQRGQT